MNKMLILCMSLHISSALAGEIKYPVSQIPAELKENVNAVVREDKMVYRILSRSKAVSYTYSAITIFNEKGNSFAKQVLMYNKLSSITDISGAAYDANGQLIKKLKKAQILDQSAFDGFSLFSDTRLKFIDLSQATYPYTVVFETEKEYRYLYEIDDSVIIPGENVSVQSATYQLVYPPELRPRIKTLNLNDAAPKVEKVEDKMESMLWTFQNLKPIKLEPMGPYRRDVLPQILAAPGQFEYDGYPGDMSSWETYGKWNQDLRQGRDQLPEATRQKVRELTSGLATDEAKAKVLYEYMQGKTRYVSIQLGIGGLQPFEASVVDKVGYGDCKALSNYMVALLKEAGIKGYYTIVMAGRNEPQTLLDFPSHQSNHVIVSVPIDKDTLWLECTNQSIPFGYQGTFTGNRKAMLVTDKGGVIVNTTNYTEAKNTQTRTADVFMTVNGSAKAKVRTTYSGEKYEEHYLNSAIDQYDEQKKWVQENTDIPSFDLNSFSMKESKAKIPNIVVSLDLSLNRLATVSGKRFFLTPNLMNRSTLIPEKVEGRKSNVVVKGISFTDLDTIRYHTPEELYPEFLPEPVTIKSRFGEYQISFKIDQGSLVYIRKLVVRHGEYPAETYQEFVNFFKAINKEDSKKIVFLNKT